MDVHKDRFYAALGIVMSAARSEIAQSENLIGGTPLMGWTQEEHDAYWRQRKIEAEEVYRWVHWQMRRISPD